MSVHSPIPFFVDMPSKRSKTLNYILSAALAAILLYFSFRNVQWGDFMSALRHCNWWFVVLAMVFGALSFWLRGWRWRLLLHSLDSTTSTLSCADGVYIGNVASMVIPRSGDVVRCFYVTARSAVGVDGKKKASFDKVFGTVVLERAWDIFFLGVVFLGMVAFMWNRIASFFMDLVPSGGRGVSWVLILLALAGVLFIVMSYVLRDKSKVMGKIWSFIYGIWEGVLSAVRMDGKWLFLLQTVLIWGCFWLQAACILWSLQGIDPSHLDPALGGAIASLGSLGMDDAFLIMMAGSFSGLVPVPGGFGAYHYVVSLALTSLYGVPQDIGILFATLSHESQTLMQIVAGGVAYVIETLRKKN